MQANGKEGIYMELHMETGGDKLSVRLSGELDHHAAGDMRERIDMEADRGSYRVLVLDFSGVSFMDSSGIGLIMGRYKRMHQLGGTLLVTGAAPRIEQMMRLAGLEKLGIFEEKKEPLT